MGIFNKQEEDKEINVLKIASFIAIVLVASGVSFLGGMYLVKKSQLVSRIADRELTYVGNLVGKYSQADPESLARDIDFDLFWETWDLLKKNYVKKEELTDKKLFYGALKGLVEAADDPYTVFMDPKISQEFEDDLSGTFEGIGAEIGIRNEVLTIIAPLADSPAQKAGLKAGDKILAIDGENSSGLAVDEAVNRIRGEKGSQVTLTIFREDGDEAKDYEITRDIIVIKSVATEMRADGIFVIEVTSFNSDTGDLFKQAVNEAIQKNPRGIVLDLRNNPGGYLDMAVEIAGNWVEDELIVSEKFDEDKKRDYKSTGRARLKDMKTVVLINRGSASASEIVAGALRDHKKATIIGEQSYGKGSVQTLEDLPDGSSVKITVAEWLTPNGDNINKEGIKPDVEVEMANEDYQNDRDPQLDKAVEEINSINN